MLWLSGALLVVIAGLMFFLYICKKRNQKVGSNAISQLVLGMLAIFTYVGVEVAIGSNLGELLKLDEFGGLQSSYYISMYWGSLMIGRWAGAISAFNLQGMKKTLALLLIPIIAFGIIFKYYNWKRYETFILVYVCVIIQIIAFFLVKINLQEH